MPSVTRFIGRAVRSALVASLTITVVFAVLALPFVDLSKMAPGENLRSVLGGLTVDMVIALVILGPLIICGWLWGYARMAMGFGTAWMLHMAHNLPSALVAILLGAA